MILIIRMYNFLFSYALFSFYFKCAMWWLQLGKIYETLIQKSSKVYLIPMCLYKNLRNFTAKIRQQLIVLETREPKSIYRASNLSHLSVALLPSAIQLSTVILPVFFCDDSGRLGHPSGPSRQLLYRGVFVTCNYSVLFSFVTRIS